MQKIYESPLHGWDESAERIYIYELENDDEFWELEDMTHEQRCEYFGVFDETGYFVMPGAKYYTYSFAITLNHVIITETVAYNV